jgi:hypothetical protein
MVGQCDQEAEGIVVAVAKQLAALAHQPG